MDGFVEQFPLDTIEVAFRMNLLKGYKTALNTENLPYYAPFNFIKQSTSSLSNQSQH